MLRIRTALAVGLTLVGLTGVASAQTVDEVIKKHIDAIGGKEAWAKVTGMRMEGSVMAQGTEVDLTMSRVLHTGSRVDISVMGMSGYRIMTPTEGWSYMPFQGQQAPEAMTADDIKQGQDELLDPGDPFVRMTENGTKAELVGKEEIEGTDCFKVKLTYKSGKVTTAFIDSKNYYCIRQSSKVKANGQEMEIASDFSNFKKLPEGVTVPMTIGSPMGSVDMKKVEINPKLDDNVFKKS